MTGCDWGVLGGGVAGLSVAHFLQQPKTIVFEKENRFGGLARSYEKNELWYDVGPHIMFSKNKFVLDFMRSLSEVKQHRRSNIVLHRGKYVQYPFENHLAQLEDPAEIEYCVNTFLNNPYKDFDPNNMLAFFLKTFGEGITRLYLQPYNEKIWKFDPAMLNTKMVDRIPRPPDEDILKSARGEFSDGYLHQLLFYYPVQKGIQSLVDGLIGLLKRREVRLESEAAVLAVEAERNGWRVKTSHGDFFCRRIVNCMPLSDFLPLLTDVPDQILSHMRGLRYNSLCTVVVNTKRDYCGDNFTFTVAQKDILFHRVNKLDFMGDAYHLPQSASYLLEVTFREGDTFSTWREETIVKRCLEDLIKIGFIRNPEDVNWTDVRKERYAYVIYDLNHARHAGAVLTYLRSRGIECVGRFAEWEYMNMDGVIEHAQKAADRLHPSPISVVSTSK